MILASDRGDVARNQQRARRGRDRAGQAARRAARFRAIWALISGVWGGRVPEFAPTEAPADHS